MTHLVGVHQVNGTKKHLVNGELFHGRGEAAAEKTGRAAIPAMVSVVLILVRGLHGYTSL